MFISLLYTYLFNYNSLLPIAYWLPIDCLLIAYWLPIDSPSDRPRVQNEQRERERESEQEVDEEGTATLKSKMATAVCIQARPNASNQ